MKVNNLAVFAMILGVLASGMAGADDDYSPAEYQPKDSYSEQYAGTAAPSMKKAARVNIDNSVIAGNKPEMSPATSNADTQSEQSPMFVETIVLAIGLVAVGAFRFRSKLPRMPLFNTVSTIAGEAPESSTGVERYLEKMAASKTGVEKYLDRQAAVAPPTTVAKYLAKQIVKNYR